MHYVKSEIVEEKLAGKTPAERQTFVRKVINPGLEALWKLAEERKVVGGVLAGLRGTAFMMDVESNDEGGRLLRSLPLLGVSRWSVLPLQSFQSALDQEVKASQAAHEMVLER